jgi:MFS family permease
MYAIDWNAIFLRNRKVETADQELPIAKRVSGTVWALGATSLLTDVSSEMVASVLPMYLVLQLGLSPLAFGFVDGLYQGVAALVRVAGGFLGDRWRRYKELAAAGYGLSAACRVLLPAAGGAWQAIASIVAVDRIGKGIRTAPRDAMIALRTNPKHLGLAFGVHRSLDAAGAFLGPVLAFVILARMERAFDVLFVASFFIALLGLAVLLLFVPAAIGHEHQDTARVPLRTVLSGKRFRALFMAAALLGIPTISDSFLFLAVQGRLNIAASSFPLLFVGTSLATALLSMPVGRLADRLGRIPVFLAGYVVLAGSYVAAQFVSHPLGVVAPLALLGAYYAATDGVLAAEASASLPAAATGSGLAALATITNIARLLASALFGAVWTGFGIRGAIWAYCAILMLLLPVAALALGRAYRHSAGTAH